MPYSIGQIIEILGCHCPNVAEGSTQIRHLLIDSRQLSLPDQSLFFALAGKRTDGHHFVPDLYSAGLRHFVVRRDFESLHYPDANFLKVDSPLQALQQLAAHHRRQFDLPVIGITGSNGKTIVKEWLYELLRDDYTIVRSPRSYNSQIGVPLSVWQISPEDELAIFEAGISKFGEMPAISKVLQCGIGLFTNIGTAHNEGFESENQKISEKIQLFHSAHTIIFSLDHTAVAEAVQALEGKQLCCWSKKNPTADLYISDVQSKEKSTLIKGMYRGQEQQIQIPFRDAASVENAIHCWLMLLFLDVPAQRIQERMKRLEAVAMRLELIEGPQNCTLINDSYNFDLNALQIALSFVDQQSYHPRRTLLLSDMYQSGLSREQLYQQIAQLIVDWKIDRLVGIGQAILILDKLLPPSIERSFFDSTDQFLQEFQQISFQNEAILLKGARPFQFERIARRLSRQVHQTVMEVNLSALTHNLHMYRQQLAPSTRLMVMIKASAYGSGSFELAKLLEAQRVDDLAVAYADEGIELRQAGIRLPILVLNPEESSFEQILHYKLEPEIYSMKLLQRFIEFTPPEQVVQVHLKLDTGMHRLGFEAKDIDSLVASLRGAPNVVVRSIFSHLAASEADQHDAFTQRQFDQFEEMYEHISQGLGCQPLRHILNSGGIARFPQYQMDMVRLGIGLYGIDGSGLLQPYLQAVHRLRATISQIKEVEAGETVGYSRSGKVVHPMRIATITIGYADGFLRKAGNGRFRVLLHGKEAPTVGNICMDMSMIDVTHIPQAREGDEILIFGPQQPVQLLADCLETIPYEVFTNISKRVKRLYFQD
ncbi:MAG: bifunctional UDP-N-acetylmuramoyl-tripeptide:D-alanyl-D-alanine ligase/alanine racemase [Bacteroidota bacterium]